MNKHSVAKKRATRTSRSTGTRKASTRKAAPRKARARVMAKTAAKAVSRKPQSKNGIEITAINASVAQISITPASVSKMSVSAVAAIGSALRAHKFRVGQTVFYTSSPISRPGASGSYKVVRLLPSDGDDYQYRIKHAGEAFERVAKESQLELEG